MRENECILDANAVLRFLLQDNEEQFQQVKSWGIILDKPIGGIY